MENCAASYLISCYVQGLERDIENLVSCLSFTKNQLLRAAWCEYKIYRFGQMSRFAREEEFSCPYGVYHKTMINVFGGRIYSEIQGFAREYDAEVKELVTHSIIMFVEKYRFAVKGLKESV